MKQSEVKKSGPRCSKLTMLLVNDLLKFQMVILQIHVHCYFLLEKREDPLHCKEIFTFF